MTRYLAFLRGLKVGGRTPEMSRVQEVFEGLGLSNVRSYRKSGNVSFDTKKSDREALARALDDRLGSALGAPVQTFLRSVRELEASLALDAFRDVDVDENTRLFVVFLSQPFPRGMTFPQRSRTGDVEVLRATMGEAYVVVHRPEGRPLDPTAFLQTLSDQLVTRRFLSTTTEIVAAAKRDVRRPTRGG